MASAVAPSANVKTESSPVSVDERVLTILQQNEGGISDLQLQSVLPDVDTKERVGSINKLLSAGKISLMQSGKTLLYKLKTEEEKQAGGDNQEKLIYQIISDAGNKGIWSRDIRFKSNLLLPQVNKILKSLEGKKLIKAVKCVNASKKKVYMLYDITPDRSLTGGAWYSDQDFESEFVDVLTNQCLKYLQNKLEDSQAKKLDPMTLRNASYGSSEEICEYITALGISKVELSTEDMEMLLNTLIYDGKVERSIDAVKQRTLYRAVNSPISSTSLVRAPCGICPVIQQCQVGGSISPETCKYLNDWLQY